MNLPNSGLKHVRVRVGRGAALGLAVLLGASACGAQSPTARRGTIEGVGVDGAKWSLSDHRGQWVVVAFQARWCAPCRQEVSELRSLQTTRPGVAIVTIGFSETEKDTKRFVEDAGVNWPAVPDPDATISQSWEVAALPATIVIDSTGREVKRFMGSLTADKLLGLIGEAS